MALAFLSFYAMWYIAGASTRFFVMKYPDSFLGRALVYAQ